MDSLWTEELPDQVYDWLDTVKDKATEIISLTIRLRRKQVACHYIDPEGVRRKATLYLADQGITNASEGARVADVQPDFSE